MKHLQLAAVVLLSVFILSCEKNNLGTIDASKAVPRISNASVTPDSIFIDNLTPVGGQYPISVTVRVSAAVGSSANQTVTATVIRPNSSTEFQQSTLLRLSDGLFSGPIQFNISRAQAGKYQIRFSSQTDDGLQSNMLSTPLKLGRTNSVPSLSRLNAPDSVSVAFGGSIIVQMTIAASDSDGLADIRQVYFRSLASTDTVTRFLMKDDGGRDEPQFPSFPRSGDASSGDGIYSIQVPLSITDTTQYRRNVFAFKAEDVFGDTSTTLVHNFRIRRP